MCSPGPGKPGSEADPCGPSALRLEDAQLWQQTSRCLSWGHPSQTFPAASVVHISEISFPFFSCSSYHGQYSIDLIQGLPIGMST